MSQGDYHIPTKRVDGDTLEEKMNENGYNSLLPSRYQLRNEEGEIIEDQEEVFERVAKNIAVAEAVHTGFDITEENAHEYSFDDVDRIREVQKWADKFQDAMENLKFIPNTPTIINAGDDIQQLSACFVDSPEDDMKDIGETETEASLIFQSGGGVGYDFSELRPYGDSVSSTGGIASGPITFMQGYDQNCETVAQGGVRRGAQMATMDIHHPDVIHFIHSKNKDVSLAHTLRLNDPDDPTYTDFGEAIDEAQEILDDYDGKVPKHLRNAVEGHLSNFNISVKVTDEFMESLQNDEDYTFYNPRTGEPHIVNEHTAEMYEWFGIDLEEGEEMTLPASLIWERIVGGAYENGEPGVIFIDRINDDHTYNVNAHPEYKINSTNPCSEQPLMEYEACNLGHINLSTVVDEDVYLWDDWFEMEYGDASPDEIDEEELHIAVFDFLEESIDFDELDDRVEVGTRFLDNVVTMSDFPIPEIEETVRKNRKIGLGIMGLAQLFIQIGVEYGSKEANYIAEELMKYINHRSKDVSRRLAETRGVFDNWEDSKYASPQDYPEWFWKHVGEDPSAFTKKIRKSGYPIRNHNTTTIAPTGSTSILGDTSGGCEPIYNVAYYKNVTDDIQGDEMLVEFDSLFLETLKSNDIDVEEAKEEAQELMENNEFEGPESLSTVPDEIAELFVTTSDLNSKEHASVLCSLQRGVDSSISKTLNAPYEATLEDAKDTFQYVYENGGKSVTFYRDGTRTKQVNTTRKDNEKSGEGGFPDETPTLDVRERPKTVHGETHRIQTGYGKLYVTINEDEHGPVEAFATVGKSGSNTESFTEAVARLVSLNLRAGVPVPEVIDQLRGIKSPQYGFDNGDKVKSVPDGIALALERYYEGDEKRNREEDMMNHVTTVPENYESSGSVCPDCGKELVMREGCEECPDASCGYSKC